MRLAPGLVTPGGAIPWGSGPSGLAADILLDFVNSVYRVGGTTYATAALAGFTGAGTFNASGYTATGAQNLTGTVDLPGDFVIFAVFDQPSAPSALLWRHEGSTTYQIFKAAGGEYTENPTLAGASSSSCTKIAYARSGGSYKISFGGDAVVTGGGLSANGSAAFLIGNMSAGGFAWGVPIKKIAIYKQTLTDAQIQALS